MTIVLASVTTANTMKEQRAFLTDIVIVDNAGRWRMKSKRISVIKGNKLMTATEHNNKCLLTLDVEELANREM